MCAVSVIVTLPVFGLLRGQPYYVAGVRVSIELGHVGLGSYQGHGFNIGGLASHFNKHAVTQDIMLPRANGILLARRAAQTLQ